MTTPDHDIETPAQYRDRMARLAGEEHCTADDDDDEFGDENEEAAGNAEESLTAASESGLAPLRQDTDPEGYPFNHPRVQLDELPVSEKHAVTAETESLLNGLIGECGSLLRDVAFRSACLTPDGGERIRFISAAESLVLTAAKVADVIGACAMASRRWWMRTVMSSSTRTCIPPLPPPVRRREATINDQSLAS